MLLGLLGLTALATGCGFESADPAVVTDLRILAVRADPPEAGPGDTVTMSALAADPYGNGRTIGYTWGLCQLEIGDGVSDCSLDTALVLSNDAQASVDVPTDILDGVPSDFGVDVFVLLVIEAGDETDEAIKRVRITVDPSNTNPTLDAVSVDGDTGDPVTAIAGGKLVLEATATPESLETYEVDGQTLSEEMRFSWLITEGSLLRNVSYSAEGTGETEWNLEAAPATLWVVLRDQRGGVDWTSRQLTP